MEKEKLFLHALHVLPGLGVKRLKQLLAVFGSAQNTWEASREDWRAAGIGPVTLTRAFEAKPTISLVQLEQTLATSNIHVIAETDADYPELLRSIPDAPPLLYTRGRLCLNQQPLIAVVGTRRPTNYGRLATERLVTDLAQIGFGIVSGLAFGIDVAAHRATLESHHYTVGVLGDGLDDRSIAPQSHLAFAHTLLDSGGTLLSEYPPDTAASIRTFPARNRIIAGISLGTLVIEAAERSGSLITARFALEFGREVFAVPGSIFSRLSDGPNALLRSGAKVVTSVSDILEEIPSFAQPTTITVTSAANKNTSLENQLSEHEQIIMRHLSSEPLHIDKISGLTTLEATHLSTALTLLELKGLVKNIGMMHYIKMQS